MNKHLIFFAFFISTATVYAQQADPCAGQNRTCSDGSKGICTRMRGTAPYEGEPPATYSLLCFVDGEAPPPTINGGPTDTSNNSKKETTKKSDPCAETKIPTAWDRILDEMRGKKAEITNTTKNSTTPSFAPGPGEPICKWVYSDPATAQYFKCINTSNQPTRERQEAFCADKKPEKIITTGKFDCNGKLSSNVIDTLWAFLTHRK